MPVLLSEEEIVTLRVLAKKGASKTDIACVLGVTEGAVRYHLKRHETGARDGRKNKPMKAQTVSEAIETWFEVHEGDVRPVNVLDLYDHLVAEHRYRGSYKSVLRYVRKHYPKPPIRTYRRVETPPGAQSQTDWGEFPHVRIGGEEVWLSALVMVLSYSRGTAVVWRTSKDLLSWLEAHNGAYKRLGGVAAVNRVDNVKTAVARGAGSWGTIHPVYRSYARSLCFHVDACQPRAANAKGKTEAKVRLARLRLDPTGRDFDSLAHLQKWSDDRLDAWSGQATCPATGRSVRESRLEEAAYLYQPACYPQPFDVVVTRVVGRDCLVHFENRAYSAPFVYVGQSVEVRGCATTVQIWKDGKLLSEHPRHTARRLVIDPSCYEGESTPEVLAPKPLGRMGVRLQELANEPVARRSLDYYEALAEVAR